MSQSPLAEMDAERSGRTPQPALACLLGALIWVGPRALGVWGEMPVDTGVAGLSGYLALVGCGLLSLVLVAVSLGSRTRSEWGARGLRELTLGLGLALGPWAALAYWLTVSTHHRPLGAVTYAVAACIVGSLSIALARWVLHGGSRARRLAPFAWALCAASGASLVFLVGRGAFRHSALRPALPDAALGLLLALLVAAAPGLTRGRRAAQWGVPTCVGVWVLTLGLLISRADVRATVKSAPIIAGVAGLVLP